MKPRCVRRSVFLRLRALIILFLSGVVALSIVSGRPITSRLGFFGSAASTRVSERTLSFAERVAYQRAIEDVYWRHRFWPKERRDSKPSLDAVMRQAQIERKVEDYLRKSQALEDYWQRPITAAQLQAEIDRMAKHTKQPEVLRELFAALGNDPFVIAECLARPALAERLLTNWYAYDQRIHGELRGRVETDVLAHPTVEQMKQLSGKYTEIDLIKTHDPSQELSRGSERRVKLNGRKWDETVQKLAVIFGTARSRGAQIAQIKTGVLSPLQEDETRYYATAVLQKSEDRLKLATVSWLKEPFEYWLARAESQTRNAIVAPNASYTLFKLSEGTSGCTDSWIATPGPPDAREFHTAVWTGSEMIVWGGQHNFYFFWDSGGRYNPTIDSWTAMSAANAPSARGYHTAVWTGSEMIVWGGYDGSNDLNTGGRYHPSTDSWTPTSITNAPGSRDSHTAVWTGTEMIVWGGEILFGTTFNTGGRYNPNTDIWTATNTSNAPTARYLHTAVWTGNEMIVWGGSDGSNDLNTGGTYNPGTNSWTATNTTNAPSGRDSHTVVWSGSEMIVWGGSDGTNTGGRYNPSTNNWTATSTTNAPAGRVFHTAVWSGSQMIVWGGYGFDLGDFNTGGRYEPGTNSWTPTSIAGAPSARELHATVWTGSEMIVWGGYDSNDRMDLNTGSRYDPDTDSWSGSGANNAPSARFGHTAVWTGNEMVIWGGLSDFYLVSNGCRYNPSTDHWTATSTINAPNARSSHTAVWTGSEMIVWGGGGEDFNLNTGGRYDPIANSWTNTSANNSPESRVFHTAVWTGTEMIVWGGLGNDGVGVLNTGGKYNPSTNSWTVASTTNAPEGRAAHRAVWTGNEMIVWGGYNQSNDDLNTGGKYNPNINDWTATTTTNAPSARESHTAVWTSDEMIIWGGYSSNGGDVLNTGARYNPGIDAWTAIAIGTTPDARFSHTAVWTGSEMIVWGGIDQNGFSLNTGGRYNPGVDGWTATSTTNAPSGRDSPTAVWTGSEMIVWGGVISHDFITPAGTGGRYCAQVGPTPTPTPCTGRCSPTPRPHPTQAPRP
jgi:N-acetylneuraminic acid mutarotase